MSERPNQPELPSGFDPTGEPNRFLQKYKAARWGKWSLKSTKSLGEMADLGFFLTALGRQSEAIEVLGYPANHAGFANDFNTWTWVRVCVSLRYQLLFGMGRPREAFDSISPLREHPYVTPPTEQQLTELLAERRYHMGQLEAGAISRTSDARKILLGVLYICTQISMAQTGILKMPAALLENYVEVYQLALERLRALLAEAN